MKRKLTDKLIEWKNKSSNRMPLILNGARQVGKTYILREFGEQHFQNVVYINLETNLAVASLFEEDISPKRIISLLEATTGQKIHHDKTLIILDEIQSCERALTSLKYFNEDAPEYYITAAGSLLGVAINRNKYSFPVGKVDSMTLYPLDFEEYLIAAGQELLSVEIRGCFDNDDRMPEVLHEKALELYKHYLITGGMPAAVREYVKAAKFMDIADIQGKILNDYIADMAKYASNSESVKIRAAYHSIPNQLAKDNKKFQYKLVQKGGTATLFGAALEWINFAGVVLKCQKVDHPLMPVAVYTDLSSFKIYMADVGLLTMKSGIAYQTILSSLEIDNTFLGSITENYVAQALTANGYPLYYWTSKNSAEIDFVIQKGEQVIPVEVKSGIRIRSKSLSVYREMYKPPYSIRISAKNFGFENEIKSVPLYAVFCI